MADGARKESDEPFDAAFPSTLRPFDKLRAGKLRAGKLRAGKLRANGLTQDKR